jgi:hypothetical protein
MGDLFKQLSVLFLTNLRCLLLHNSTSIFRPIDRGALENKQDLSIYLDGEKKREINLISIKK